MTIVLRNQFTKGLYYLLLSIVIHIVVIVLFYIVIQMDTEEYEEIDVNFTATAPIMIATPPRQVAPPPVVQVEKINDTVQITEEILEEEQEEIVEEIPDVPEVEFEEHQTEEETYEPFYAVDSRPTFLHKAELVYPFIEKRRGDEGVVILELDISSAGELKDYRVIKSAGENFDKSAIQMVLDSTFQPGVKQGKPVAVRMRLTVRFKLNS